MSTPSSASEPVAEQLSCDPTTTLEEGVTEGLVIDGAVFSTSTLAEELVDEPEESVAVAVQVTEDPTLVSLAVTV